MGKYLPTQSQAPYYSASSSPSARRPLSGFDVDHEEAEVRLNIAVADGHADIRASAVMTDDNDDDADDVFFDDTLDEILGALSRVKTSLELISLLAPSTPTSTSLALHFSLHSPPSPLPSPLLLLLLLAAAGEPI